MYSEQNILDLHDTYAKQQMDNRAAYLTKEAERKPQHFKEWIRERHTTEIKQFLVMAYGKFNTQYNKAGLSLGQFTVVWWQNNTLEETLDLIQLSNNQIQSNNEQSDNTGIS